VSASRKRGLDAFDDLAIHLDEAAVAVVREALVAESAMTPGTDSSEMPRFRIVSIMPGSTGRRRTYGDEQRAVGVAELAARALLEAARRL